MDVELLNRALRPGTIAAIAAAAVFFLFGLAAVMLFRYAVHGEIDWQGLAAFCSLVLLPLMQHAQNRHHEKRAGVADRPLAPAPSPPQSDGIASNHALQGA
jgi:hypothetical protein